MTLAEVKKIYTDAFPLPDDSVLDLVIAVVLNMYAKTDPLWLLLVGAPSSGKSEIVQAFYKCEHLFEISDVTENSFLSGATTDGGEASFLTQMGPFGTIAMKDFTSILSYRAEKREAIMSQMRQIYDGRYTKKTGRAKKMLEWKGKCNFLGGVTEEIYIKDDESASMGRRSILYMLPEQDPYQMMKAARTSRDSEAIELKRDHIQDAIAEFVGEQSQGLPLILPHISDDDSESLLTLSEFATYARTAVTRDRYTRDITYIHKREMPVRFSEQLHTFAETIQYLYGGELPRTQLFALHKIAFDSIPTVRRQLLYLLATYDKATTKGVALPLNLTTMTVRRNLEDLNALGLIQRISDGQGNKDWWILNQKYSDIILKYSNTEKIGGDLDSKNEEMDDEGVVYESEKQSQASWEKF